MISPSMALNLFAYSRLPLLILILITCPSKAQQISHNILLDSTLSTTGPNTSWLSPSGEFAFGFRPLEINPSEFLLAIWFVNTVNLTTVWYINDTSSPVLAGSSLQFTADGQFSLQDSTGKNLWSADVNGASYAAMTDTGNFVVYDTTGLSIWQSFDHPSDTILPSQILQLGSTLTSRLMINDYSNGRFQMWAQGGNLVFYTIALISGNSYGPYFNTSIDGKGTKLVFNETGNIYFVSTNNTWYNITSAQKNSMSGFYQRATLYYDGVFRQYIYPKKNSPATIGGWTVVDFLPKNICSLTFLSPGSGLCGFNSYCQISSDKPVDCQCLPGYSFIDPIRKYKGCNPNFAPQSCDIDQSGQFKFSILNSIDFPFGDYEYYSAVDIDTCRNICLSDCLCYVAVYYQRNGGCWKKKIPLSSGQTGTNVDRTLLVKVPKSNVSQSQPNYGHSGWKEDKKSWILGGSFLLGSSVLANILLIMGKIVGIPHCLKKKMQKHGYGPCPEVQGLRYFSYAELERATNNFTNEVGHGGCGVVYKGYIQDEADLCVAVKNINTKVLVESEKEFNAEVQTIGQTFHKNLVRLVGLCNEGAHRLLIYEFMSRGSLSDFLFTETRPNWNQRFHVALGIARGLLYLHEECDTQIIHCDIKPQNILLNENLTPKLSDFGIAKLLRKDQTRTNTGIRGTVGYVAPEWFKNVAITSMVDVYSFGVVLMEIVCCRRNIDQDVENEEQMILTYWLNDCYRDRRLDLVVEGDDEAIHDMTRVERFVKVALLCIQEEPSFRPTMLKVTQMLDGAVEIPLLPDPSSYICSFQY